MVQKLIALDLDGTALNQAGVIDDATSHIIQDIIAKGHIVCIVTGRSTRLALPAYQKLGLTTPMINFNGAMGIIPNQKWSAEYEFPINTQIVLDLLAHQAALGIQVMAAEDKQMLLANQPASSQLFKESYGFFPDQLAPNEILNEHNLTEDPIGLAVSYDHNKLAQLTTYIDQHYGQQIEIAHWGGPLSVLEIKRTGVNKAYGVHQLSQAFQINPENIIAIGDQINDLPLLRAAGTKVAMKNAVPEIKAVADMVTDEDNDHQGAAKYLAQLVD
ncbi:HAD family hydrolase [Nicoliella lavandulae]|uniref:HAD family hydrolase n=1 Tax=Nicoliella lavandulae TaxID=3082954 RepID=A0ABU8SMY4_9LACO